VVTIELTDCVLYEIRTEAEDMVYKFEAVCVLSEVRAEAEKPLSIDHIIEKSITRWQHSGKRN
jgi:hypothetical protein